MFREYVKASLSSLGDLVLPRVCVVCGSPLMPSERHICICCMADFPFTRFEHLEHNPMADRYNARIEDRLSGDGPARYEYAAALFYYWGGSGYDHICTGLKYGRNLGGGRHFARMLGKRLACSPVFRDVDAVVSVPLHWTRAARRGYNQAEIIGKEVSSLLGAAFYPRILRRCRRTRTQTAVRGAAAKLSNVSGAFEARGPLPSAFRHLLIVDDTFTTGATVSLCREALLRVCGPDVRISVATLGFVGGSGD